MLFIKHKYREFAQDISVIFLSLENTSLFVFAVLMTLPRLS